MDSFAERDGHLDHLVAAVGVTGHRPRDDRRGERERHRHDGVDLVCVVGGKPVEVSRRRVAVLVLYDAPRRDPGP